MISCHSCGQGLVPFKLSVCICGMQVGDIQYVKSPEKFATNQYSILEIPKTEKLGILQLVDE